VIKIRVSAIRVTSVLEEAEKKVTNPALFLAEITKRSL